MGIKKTGKAKPLKLSTAAPGQKARPALKPVTLGKAVAPIIKAPATKPKGR